jgi:glycosyltransferase involved in cell wall biosynthesis
VPVIATDIGAHGERIRDHGGGELVPLADPAEAVRRICAVADDPAAYERLRAEATLRGCATVADMTDRYSSLYRHVVDDRRSFVAPPGSPAPAYIRRGVLDVLAIVPGAGGVHPGSTYVRVLQRYRHPSVAAKLSLRLRTPGDELDELDGDLVLVQRTALHPGATVKLLASLRERDTPLVLELDDHLLAKGHLDRDYGAHQDSLAALIAAAELVLVSTDALALALQDRARAIAVVPNLVDERLFLAGVREPPRAAEQRFGAVQLVYVGSPTHARDLELLMPVLAELERRRPGGFELNVVGVEPPGPDQGWYRRVPVPDQCKPYPRFVGWLREQRPRWDIGLAPLRDDEFNRYKSDLKHLEYAALGLPAVFSETEPYLTVEHERTGLKAGEHVEEWVDAVIALADDEALHDAIADAAFRYVTSHRLMRHHAPELLELLHGVVARGAVPAGLPGVEVPSL